MDKLVKRMEWEQTRCFEDEENRPMSVSPSLLDIIRREIAQRELISKTLKLMEETGSWSIQMATDYSIGEGFHLGLSIERIGQRVNVYVRGYDINRPEMLPFYRGNINLDE